MKICWDNLEKANLSKEGNFRIGTSLYIEMDSCKVCGSPYLTKKHRPGLFCSRSCALSGENNPFFGQIHTAETKKRMSESKIDRTGCLNPNYKGAMAGLALYNNYNELGFYDDIRKDNVTELLEIRCAYCNRWYVPTIVSVRIRLRAIGNLNQGEGRLYCSENCKQSCPTYNQMKHPKGFKKGTSREVSTYLRQMVFERDNWECQRCGKTIKEAILHCHHIKGYTQNKILANDIDNCITLCKGCHKELHRQKGCRYIDLQCKENK